MTSTNSVVVSSISSVGARDVSALRSDRVVVTPLFFVVRPGIRADARQRANRLAPSPSSSRRSRPIAPDPAVRSSSILGLDRMDMPDEGM